jgi:hypothetical protein
MLYRTLHGARSGPLRPYRSAVNHAGVLLLLLLLTAMT